MITTKTNTFNAKRFTAVVLCVVMMLSVVTVFGSASAGAVSANDVQLYSCNITFAKYGFARYDIYVTTTGNSSNEQVFIHYNRINTDQKWLDEEAEYVKTLDNGAKLRKASLTSYDLKYAIKYVCNGVTVWNNNNGNDFTNDDVIGSGAAIEVQRRGYQCYGDYEIYCVLQNYAYHKNVTVRYTTNNWQSYTDAALSYDSTNANGTENWTADLSLSYDEMTNIEYAVCYQVNGQTYWANNFGENYGYYFYINK